MPLVIPAMTTSTVKIMPQKIALSDISSVRASVAFDIFPPSFAMTTSLEEVA
jgi:hypothetical protein